MNTITKLLKFLALIIAVVCYIAPSAISQTKTEKEEKIAKYKFDKRLVGPKHQKSSVLEIMVDKYNNYMVATFRAEKLSHTYLRIYRLYSWEELVSIRMNDRRIELYNSTFDPDGNYFFANTDIYRNRYKKIDINTKEVEEVDCSVVPNGCVKIEPRQYLTEAYTENNHYYIYSPERYPNSILILRSKDLISTDKARIPSFLLDEDESSEQTEKELNMTDPNLISKNQNIQQTGQTSAQGEHKESQETGNCIDFVINKRTLEDLERYKYSKVSDYEILINNWLSATFVYEPNKTKSITISEYEFNILVSNGSVTKGGLRLVLTRE